MKDNTLLSLKDVLDDYNNNVSSNLVDLLEESRIGLDMDLKRPDVALIQINEQNPEDERIICTLENIMLITGKAKSRKSFLIASLTASLLSGKTINGIKGCLPPNQLKGLLVDTEQGKYHVFKSFKRIAQLTNLTNTNNLEVLAFRKYSPNERLALLEYAVYNKKGLGFLIIDGIKDLVTSINDEDQATMIVSKLMKWSEELNIVIIIVLHQNKGNEFARGHLGTEAQNKAETVLSVSKSEQDKDISVVEFIACRNKEPETFAFEINENNLPVLAEDYQIRTETKTSRLNFNKIEDHKIFGLLNEVFSYNSEYSYSKLVIQLKLKFEEKFNRNIGNNKVKELITYCKNNDWIVQEAEKKPYTLGKYIDA